MKSSIQRVIQKEGKRSYDIEVTKFGSGIEDDKFIIPVIDVRDGKRERAIIANMTKQNNRSKYMQPSFSAMGRSYQVSHKR